MEQIDKCPLFRWLCGMAVRNPVTGEIWRRTDFRVSENDPYTWISGNPTADGSEDHEGFMAAAKHGPDLSDPLTVWGIWYLVKENLPEGWQLRFQGATCAVIEPICQTDAGIVKWSSLRDEGKRAVDCLWFLSKRKEARND